MLGLRPTQRRDFAEGEHTPYGPTAVMLSDGFWRRSFHAAPTVIGQQLILNNISHKIIGVMPQQATFPRKAEVIVTLYDRSELDVLTNRGNRDAWSACGRLKTGIMMAQGRTDLDYFAADHLNLQRLTTMLLSVFAAVALSLAVMGLYGMTALSVTRRTHELNSA